MDVGLNNRNTLGEIEPALADVVFLVDATNCEVQNLWEEWSKDSMNNIQPVSDEITNSMPDGVTKTLFSELNEKVKQIARTRVDWEQINMGFSLTIGNVDNRPIVIEFFFAKINGKKIAFYNCCSQLADHKMVEDFLISRFQLTHDNYSRWNHVDANNFHNCVNSLYNLDKEPRDTVYNIK